MGEHNAIIIGTGQAGPSLARRLVAAGQKVAIVARAYAAHLARRAGDYGVTVGGPVGIDMKAVKARKDAVAGASGRGVERSLKALEGCTVYEGHARFVAE